MTISDSDEQGPTQEVLRAASISKRFGATEALVDVDLDLRAGEVHCLVGENGAGKSTFAKIVTGVERPDTGSLRLDGDEVALPDVHAARELGVVAVYQHPMLFPDLTVAENVFAGRHPTANGLVHWTAIHGEVSDILERIGAGIDPRGQVASLSVADQQLVEVGRALSLEARVLILDEPTASLSGREVDALFGIVRDLTRQGVGVLFITHRIEEVFEVADRVTVLRDGRKVGTYPVEDVDRAEIIRLMVGRPLDNLYPKQDTEKGDVVLEVEGLAREGVFADIAFSLRAGEILGFAGLVGAGRSEVCRALFGVDLPDRGTVRLGGQTVRPRSPGQMLRHGLAYLPEDRHDGGLVLPWPIRPNVSLPILSRISWRGAVPRVKAERELAEHYVELLSVRAEGPEQSAESLSGGNQQKVLLAKWLAADPVVLVLDEPTRGIDVGAKAEVHRAITELAAQGLGIVLVSSELPEILAMSDRILVFCEGRITGAFMREEATQEAVMRAATDYRAAVRNEVAHGSSRRQAS